MQSQKGVTLWFTGLSGVGKTTVALEVGKRLLAKGYLVERLDGDVVREHLTRDLGFSRADRDENIRRNSFVAALLTRNGIITLCCFISPYRQAREEARRLIGSFVEIYVNAPLEVCESRDTKGLYARARAGEITEFTGVSDPYEPPEKPDIELKTDQESVSVSAEKVISFLQQHGYIDPGPVDLHIHTNFSDGQFTPAEIIKAAKDAGFGAIAITDHDTTQGIKPALEAAFKHGLEVIPGIELSALDEEKEIHILGYFIDPENIELQKVLEQVKVARRSRADVMINKLNSLGVDISSGEVRKMAGKDIIGRPHIARVMQEKGYIADLAEAFSKEYIGRGGRAYVERFKITPGQAIDLVLSAGGIPVLAHPGYLSDRTSLRESEIAQYVAMGLKGIEVYYSRHTLKQAHYYKNIALRHELLITGGTDFHGHDLQFKENIRLPYKHLQELKNHI